jgi:hypothetical protein
MRARQPVGRCEKLLVLVSTTAKASTPGMIGMAVTPPITAIPVTCSGG